MELLWGIVAVLLLAVCHADEDMVILPKGPEQTKSKGENFAFTCRLNVPKPDAIKNFRWLDPENKTIDENYIQQNPRFSTYMPQSNTLVLKFSKLIDKDVGRYTCEALYADTKQYTASSYLKLLVPITFIDAPEEQFARVGDTTFKLKCKVQANPSPTVGWLKNNEKLEDNDKYFFDTEGLAFKNGVQESDDGSYVCEVMVPDTGELRERNIHLEVISKPKVSPSLPETFNVTEGEPTRIQCNATGKPQPTISWIKTSTRKNLTYGLDGVLYIEKVAKDDDGEFKCVATNKAGEDERAVRFLVQSKPEVIEVVNGTSIVGKSGHIDCVVYGNPEPNVTIRKFGFRNQEINIETNEVRTTLEKIPDPKGRYNGKAMLTTLKFTTVDRSDDGLYQCVANNKVGETIANMHLAVEFKPSFEKSGLINRTVTWTNRPVNLTCIAQGIPNATITWYHGSSKEQIKKDRFYTIYGTGWSSILQVNPLDKSVYGPYKCRAVNAHGEDVFEIKLEEATLPPPPANVRDNNTAATSVTFVFQDSMHVGNLPVKGYTVQYIFENQDWSNARNHTWPCCGPYILTGLQPSTKYLFRFAIINEVGTGPWGGFIDIQTPNMSPPSEPVISNNMFENEKYIKSPYARKIELRWNIPSNNGLPIDKYAIKYCVVNEIDQDVYDDQKNSCNIKEMAFTEVLSSYDIENLQPDTIYSIELSAHNSMGLSAPSRRYFKTNATTETSVEMQPGGLSSAVIIWVVVAVLIAFLVIIDIFCFFIGETGVLYTLFGGCCGKKKKNDDKLGSESKDLISNGHKKIDIEEQSPMIADGTKKDTAVEYDMKKGTAKTGFVGKDSAV